MKRYIAPITFIALLAGCGGDSVNDNSQGPSMNGYSRTSNIVTNNTSYHDSVEISIVKRFHTEGTAVDIVLSEDGRTAYIATGSFGLEVIDVTNPEYPRFIQRVEFQEYVNHVSISDGRVYVANVQNLQQYSTVYAFDIYSNNEVNYIGSSQGNSGVGHESVTLGEYHYTVTREGLEIFKDFGTSIYDRVGSHYLDGTAYALAVYNNYVFVANGIDGLTVLKTDINGMIGHVN